MKPRTLALLVLAGALLLSGCAAATPSSAAAPSVTAALSSPTVRTSDGGQVSVAVDWRGPAAGAVFDVTLDTHTVDLDALDLADAVLRNDRGEWMSALPWAAPLGGHHRAGPLTFAGDAAPFFNGAMWIELVVSGVGDIPERTLRWEIAT